MNINTFYKLPNNVASAKRQSLKTSELLLTFTAMNKKLSHKQIFTLHFLSGETHAVDDPFIAKYV